MASPAGAISTTASDMVKYLRVLMKHSDYTSILPTAVIYGTMYMRHQVFNVDASTLSESDTYGGGFMQGSYQGHPVIGHAGGSAGFMTDLRLFGEPKELGVYCSQTVQFYRLNGGNSLCARLTKRIADMLYNITNSEFDEPYRKCPNYSTPTAPKEQACGFNATFFTDVEGTYNHPLFGDIVFTFDAGAEKLKWKMGLYGQGTVCPQVEKPDVAWLTIGRPLNYGPDASAHMLVRYLRVNGSIHKMEATGFVQDAPPVFTKI